MSTKAKHTPVPWKRHDDVGELIMAEETLVCLCVGGLPEGVAAANAEFIVLACNAHEDLVKACKLIDDWLELPAFSIYGPAKLTKASAAVRAALAKARGE